MQTITAKALLFDVDGTLVNSSAEIEHVWTTWCARHQIPVFDVLKICIGVRSEDVLKIIAPTMNINKEVSILDEQEENSTIPSIEIIGAKVFLKELPVKRWAIVTSANRKVALRRMANCNLPVPEVLINADDIQNGKPDPEAYLLAARIMRVKPNECLVFEDSKAGINSALSAGCRVIQVGGDKIIHRDIVGYIQNFKQIKIMKYDDDGIYIMLI